MERILFLDNFKPIDPFKIPKAIGKFVYNHLYGDVPADWSGGGAALLDSQLYDKGIEE